ncbi:hypothetical protein [Microbacterium sp. B35-04]|jgi:hypothetical protein|nr:hypothetical protein [Microbacterium sp. B35-04]
MGDDVVAGDLLGTDSKPGFDLPTFTRVEHPWYGPLAPRVIAG